MSKPNYILDHAHIAHDFFVRRGIKRFFSWWYPLKKLTTILLILIAMRLSALEIYVATNGTGSGTVYRKKVLFMKSL